MTFKPYIIKFIFCVFVLAILLSTAIPHISFANDVDYPIIHSPVAILVEVSSGKVLYEKNIHEKMFPASLTKVMTALIVLEEINLNEIAVVSENAVMSLGPRICYSKPSGRRNAYY
jgi:D-alanyl-D-alanine carboxypeptidase